MTPRKPPAPPTISAPPPGVRVVNNTRVIQSRAIRQGIKARIAIAAPTGYGKTWTALSIATELQGDLPTLHIDTERGSAALYGHDAGCESDCTRNDHFTFEWVDWMPPYSPAELTHFLEEESGNYGVIIIDSLSHFWKGEGGTLDLVDAISARADGREGNKFASWKQGDAIQNQMVEAILASRAHMIVTMRSKMAYEQQKNERTGKQEVVKVGLAPVQREGIEFEFTVLAELDREHRLIVTKSRCSLIADKVYLPHREREMARTLAEWLDTAAAVAAPRLTVTLNDAKSRVHLALQDLDKQSARNILVAAGWEKPATVGAWLDRCGRDEVIGLVARLRLPLNIEQEAKTDAPADPSVAPAAVLTGTEAAVRALDATLPIAEAAS